MVYHESNNTQKQLTNYSPILNKLNGEYLAKIKVLTLLKFEKNF